MAFVLATSKLADLRARVLRARWLDVQLLLDDLCQDGLPPLPSLHATEAWTEQLPREPRVGRNAHGSVW